MLEYFVLMSVFTFGSSQWQSHLPPVVDPILCNAIARQTEWTELDLQLLSLCRLKDTGKDVMQPAFLVREEEEVVKNVSGNVGSNKSRLLPHQQTMVVDLHNEFRRQVIPSPANMEFMKWDDALAASAQKWADNCEFRHSDHDYDLDDIFNGENLYVGSDASGLRAITLWYEENEFYDFTNDECLPDEQCGHYTQLVWATTEYVGCAVSKCRTLGYLYVCHYSPRGNYPDVSPYIVGVPCSQCRNGLAGGLCYRKACVSPEICKQDNLECSCDLKCRNCGRLIENQCRCVCKNGWDSLDCSKPCVDLHEFCGQDPGWPNAMSCGREEHKVRDEHCRKMCKQCRAVVDDGSVKNEKDYCCEGKMCEEGKTLNGSCDCQLLCPGPACYAQKELYKKIADFVKGLRERLPQSTEGTSVEESIEGSGAINVVKIDYFLLYFIFIFIFFYCESIFLFQ